MRLTELLAEAGNLRAELERLDGSGKSTDKKVFVHAHLVGSYYRNYPKLRRKKKTVEKKALVLKLVGGGRA